MAETLNISDIRLYNLLKAKFGEKEAEDFVSLIKDEVEYTVQSKQEILSKDIAILGDDLNKDFKYLRDEIIRGFATKEDLAKTESKLLLWDFVFWATQLGAIFAFLKLFIK